MRNRLVLSLTAGLAAVVAMAGTATAVAARTGTVTAAPATLVAQLAGVKDGPATAHPNNTSQWNLRAADLGIMWREDDGTTSVVFGDNYGYPWKAPATSGPCASVNASCATWRSNAILRAATEPTPTTGLKLSGAVTGPDGTVKEILPRQAGEATVIPTGAINVYGVDIMAYMSVRTWGGEGEWTTNRGGLAYSTDRGQNWQRTNWAFDNSTGDDPFQQMTFASNGNGTVYVWGTPNGRYGNAYLARVCACSMNDRATWQFWTGRTGGWVSGPDSQAVPVVPGTVGEMSVQWDPGVHRWLMTYLDEHANAVVLRTASSPTGPWSAEQVLVSRDDWPQVAYGGFMYPATGTDLYLAVSMFLPYQTYIFHTTLTVS